MKKIYNLFIKYFVESIFFLVILYYLIKCTIYSQTNPNYNVYFLIFIILLFYFIIYKILVNILDKHEKHIKLNILFGSIIIYSIWNIVAKTVPVSDYEVLINGAKSMLNGTFSDLSFNPENYFYFYNFQTGFTLYLSLIMKLLGSSLMSLKVVEILVLSFSNLLVYMITSKIYTKKIGIISAMLYSTLLFNIGGSSIINNQHISMLFILLSLYFLTKDDNIISKILCGILLAISYILRQSSIIFLIAIVCYYIWRLMNDNFKNFKKCFLSITLICISLFTFIKIFDFTVKTSGIVPNSAISGNLKYFKYVLGIQGSGITGTETFNAEKTQIYYDLKNYDFNYDKYNIDSKKYIINKYKNNTKDTLKYIDNKMYIFTSSPDNQIDFAKTENISNNTYNFMKYYGYAQYILIIILSLFYITMQLKSQKSFKSYNDFDIVFIITFIGYFLVHFFIEVQPRYRYDQYLILCILSAPILEYIFNKISLIKYSVKPN